MYLQIGLMRPGILLACPQTLMSLHGLSTLEDVFLKLCMKDREPVRPRWSHFVWLSVGTRLIWNWKLIWNRRTGSECRPCLQLHGRVRAIDAQLQVLTIHRQRHSGPGKWNLQLLRGTIALYGNMEMARHWPDIYWRFYQLRAQVLDWVDELTNLNRNRCRSIIWTMRWKPRVAVKCEEWSTSRKISPTNSWCANLTAAALTTPPSKYP